MLKHYKKMGSAIALSLMVSAANAAVSQQDAAKLDSTLTPIGAEKAGNGSDIPAWDGGITKPPAGYTVGQKHVDPYAGDKPKFVITAANYKEYADKLQGIVNKIRLLGEELSGRRVVEKLLVTLPETFNAKISALE